MTKTKIINLTIKCLSKVSWIKPSVEAMVMIRPSIMAMAVMIKSLVTVWTIKSIIIMISHPWKIVMISHQLKMRKASMVRAMLKPSQVDRGLPILLNTGLHSCKINNQHRRLAPEMIRKTTKRVKFQNIPASLVHWVETEFLDLVLSDCETILYISINLKI